MIEQGPEKQTSTPTWVKVFGFVALVVVVLVIAMLVLGGGKGGHSAERHSQASIAVARAYAGPSLVASLL